MGTLEVIPPRPHGQNTRSKRWILSGEGRIDEKIVEQYYLSEDMGRTGMVNMRDKRDYGYVGTGEANYGKVDTFNEMVSDEVKKLFLSLSESEKAAVCGLSGPRGGPDTDRRVQGEGDERGTDDE